MHAANLPAKSRGRLRDENPATRLTFRRAAQRRCGNERISRATDIATVARTSTAGRPSGDTGDSTQRRRSRLGVGSRSSRRLASTDADEVIRGATKRDFLTPFDDGARRSSGQRLRTADGEIVCAGRCSDSRHRRRGQERTARDARGTSSVGSRASRSLLFSVASVDCVGEARLHENASARYALVNRERAFGASIGVSRLGGSAAGLH